MDILDANGAPLPAEVRVPAQRRASMNAYNAARIDHASMANWMPGRYSGQSALRMTRETMLDRVNDAVRNNGWADAGVSRMTDIIVGTGWRLTSRPSAASLNLDPELADEIGSQIEALWRDYAEDPDFGCDAEENKTMTGILGLAIRHRFTDGEAFATLPWKMSANGYGTTVQIIDPARISNPNGAPDTQTLRDGIELDAYGAAVACHVRRNHPGDLFVAGADAFTWDRIARRDEYGRPLYVHAFEARRAGMVRGQSPWASIVQKLKQISDYDDAELQAATLNAVMAAFITTPNNADEMAEAMGTRADSSAGRSALSAMQQANYKEAPIRMPGAQVNFLLPGEEVTLTDSKHPNANFSAFVDAALRNIASAIGLTYEQLTMDWSKVNYSSARAALLEIWRGLSARKSAFTDGFMMPVFRAFLEEVFDQRRIVLPDRAVSFEANPAAWCRSEWIGPGRGWVDPEKEAKASVIRLGANISTLRDECAEQGKDYQEIIRQRGREKRMLEAEGLPESEALAIAAASAPNPADQQENAK